MAGADKDYVPIMVGSAVSGMLARIPMHPIDTLKARLQAVSLPRVDGATATASATARPAQLQSNVPAAGSSRSSLLGVFRSTLANEGIRGLYRGFPIAFLGSAPASCLYFTSYEAAKANLAGSDTVAAAFPTSIQHFIAGFTAETVSCVLWVPIDVIKERMQIRSAPGTARPGLASGNLEGMQTGMPGRGGSNVSSLGYINTRHAMATILRHEGLSGLYRGYWATLASFGPFSALYFVFYERFKAWARPLASSSTSVDGRTRPKGGTASSVVNMEQLPFHLQVLSACSAGAAASFLTNPLDLVKLRLQVQRGNAHTGGTAVAGAVSAAAGPLGGVGPGPGLGLSNGLGYHYTGVVHGLRTVLTEEGPRGLWRGAGARMLFHAPTTALSMVLFERCTGLARTALGRDNA